MRLSTKVLLIVAGASALAGMPPAAGSHGDAGSCDGMPATFVGTEGPDVINTQTDPGEVVVDALGGNDQVTSDNLDTVCLGRGDDTARVIMANTEDASPARVLGGDGADRIVGLPIPGLKPWPLVVDAGAGDDFVQGLYRDLRGGSGNDAVTGSAYDDTIDGGTGSDRLYGGRGNDLVDGGPGFDFADGGPGIDTCHAELEINCERN